MNVRSLSISHRDEHIQKMIIRFFRSVKRRLKVIAGREIAIPLGTLQATEFHGTDYGGWTISAESLGKTSIVYSFGVGEDASFDLSLIEKYQCRLYAFDPTPKSASWVGLNIQTALFDFEPSALADHDGYLRLYLPKNPTHVSASLAAEGRTGNDYFDAPCYRLHSIMRRLGHTRLDVLKMDIEGAEYSVIREIFSNADGIRPTQLLVEFHHWMRPFTVQDTRVALSLLEQVGYRVAWVSRNGHEVLFIQQTV